LQTRRSCPGLSANAVPPRCSRPVHRSQSFSSSVQPRRSALTENRNWQDAAASDRTTGTGGSNPFPSAIESLRTDSRPSVGQLGGAGTVGTGAVGETPNVAARVQVLAEPNSVLITAATHRLIVGVLVEMA
jgi:hypothetical protein